MKKNITHNLDSILKFFNKHFYFYIKIFDTVLEIIILIQISQLLELKYAMFK